MENYNDTNSQTQQNWFKRLFLNLSKGQIVFFTLLVFLLIILIIPYAKDLLRGVKENVQNPYTPWDPDNSQTLKEKIVQLNKEGDQLNTDYKLLDAYRDDLKFLKTSFVADVTSITGKQGIRNKMQTIQPYTILNPSTFTVNDYGSNDNSKSFLSQLSQRRIETVARQYSAEYLEIIRSLNCFPIPANYGNGFSYIYLDNNSLLYTPIKLADTLYAGNDSSQTTIKNRFEAGVRSLSIVIDSLYSIVDRRLLFITNRTIELTKEENDAKDNYSKNNLNINKDAVWIGIPLFITATLLMYIFGVYNNNKLKEDLKSAANFNSEDYKVGLNFTLFSITVLLLILTIIILGLANILKDNSLSALLGMIAGYILNTANNSRPQAPQAVPSAANTNLHYVDEIKKLDELRASNSITQDEYDLKKKALLNKG